MQKTNIQLSLAALSVSVAIMLGAMGAHALEPILSAAQMKTFMTGNHYHLSQSLGLMIIIGLRILRKQDFLWPIRLLWVGILFFSGNCYLYSFTQIKFFAMIIPLGGISFILAWLILSWQCFQIKTQEDN